MSNKIKKQKNNVVFRSALWGTGGSIILFGVYFLILTIANSVTHAWQQFILLWPWMSLLIIGFGVQVGLFAYLRMYKKGVLTGSGTASVAATGGVSAGSMVVCCLHHVTDVLPILGLSAATVFLSKYQSFFLGLGIASNLVGITFIFKTMQKHNLYFRGGLAEKMMRFNMKKIFIITLLLGSLALIFQLMALLWG